MRVKRKTIYWNGFKFVLTFPANCQVVLRGNSLEISDGKLTTQITLDPIKPQMRGAIPLAIKTPYNFSLIHKP